MDDLPTGPIPAATLTRIIEEAEATGPSAQPAKTEANPVLARALADREALIRLCLYALDRARSGGVSKHIEQGLAEIGVVALRPDGQRFDPAQHEAGGTVETDDPNLDGLVAQTEMVGFADHDRLLRAPVVMVYKKR